MGTVINVGVTGHRNPRREDIPAIRALVRETLEKLRMIRPDADFVLLDSIASGADSLCAEEALKLGYKLVCPLPAEEEVYRGDFSGEELAVYERLLNSASEVFVPSPFEPYEDGRDYGYRQAGIYVALHSRVLLALWDGSPAEIGGCGTAETVDFMLRPPAVAGERTGAGGTVIHVLTPREGSDEKLVPRLRILEREPGELERSLKQADC